MAGRAIPGTAERETQAPVLEATPVGWQDEMRNLAQNQIRHAHIRERHRNPMIPDDFLDTRDSGLPSDMMVKGVQVPRQGIPAEVAQYERFRLSGFQHVRWDWVSKNGGADGKANIPGAERMMLGNDGMPVAAIGGCYLMYIDRGYYEEKRGINRERRNSILNAKTEKRTEEVEKGVSRSVHMDRVNIESFEHLQEVENDPSERERKGS